MGQPGLFGQLDGSRACWVSSPDSRHSRNIDCRSAVAITVFDSAVEVGRAEAAYADAEAEPAAPEQVDAALRALNARLPHKRLTAAHLRPRGSMVVYRGDVRHWYLLMRGGNPQFGNELDMTVEV